MCEKGQVARVRRQGARVRETSRMCERDNRTCDSYCAFIAGRMTRVDRTIGMIQDPYICDVSHMVVMPTRVSGIFVSWKFSGICLSCNFAERIGFVLGYFQSKIFTEQKIVSLVH
jgi:hypothetical protein